MCSYSITTDYSKLLRILGGERYLAGELLDSSGNILQNGYGTRHGNDYDVFGLALRVNPGTYTLNLWWYQFWFNSDSLNKKGFYDFSITQPASDTDAEFGVRLENDPSQDVIFDYATVNSAAVAFEEYVGDRTETATASEDYTAVCGTLTFTAFTTNLTQTISIPILGDATVEPNEYFNIHLGKPTNAVIQPSTARIEIVTTTKKGLLP